MKQQINDEEFERLGWYEQRDYRWCPECEVYFHIESDHICRNYKIEVKE